MSFLPDNPLVHSLVLLASFLLLAKSAGFLVDGGVGIAYRLKIPKIVIGVVLVGFATTAPEFAVSVLSAIRGFPEIALGNAIGSVIVDDGLALALGILVAPVAVQVDRKVLRIFGIFLIAVDLIAFGLALNGVFNRWEGLILLSILAGYLLVVFHSERRKHTLQAKAMEKGVIPPEGAALERAALDSGDPELGQHIKPGGLPRQFLRFFIGVAGVILGSEFLIDSAVFIAAALGASRAFIGLTLVAIGTSLPEIVTCIVAFRRGHGDLALGDIIGADILNILWIIGAAAVANPIQVDRDVILFAFPWMLFMVGSMLLLARIGHRLKRWKGLVLLGIYGLYLILTLVRFYSTRFVLF